MSSNAAVLDRSPRPNHLPTDRPTDRPTAAQTVIARPKAGPAARRHDSVGRLRAVLGRRMRVPASGRGRAHHVDRPDEQAPEAHASVERGFRRDRRRVQPAGAQPRGCVQEPVENHAAVQLDRVVGRQIRQIVAGVTRRATRDATRCYW